MSKKNSKSNDEPSATGAPAWMVTYGDLMTLLLTFFVIIVSFSTIEIEKFRAAMGSFRGAMHLWNPSDKGAALIKARKSSYSTSPVSEAAEEILEIVEDEGLATVVEVHQAGGGVRIIFSDPVLFDEGKDDLKPGIIPTLQKIIGVAVKTEADEIMIEGHTDDTPIHTSRFPTNWELSAARALKVLKLFQGNDFDPKKLVAVGYGEYRPRKQLPLNATREEKGVNRRVEIFLNFKQKPEGLFSNFEYNEAVNAWGD